MKALILLLLAFPIGAWAQTDTLKLIEAQLTPSSWWNGNYWSPGLQTQYVYDGVDIRRAKDLKKYINASGDPNAMGELRKYMASRQAGTVFVLTGIASMITGAAVMLSNRPDNDGRFTQAQNVPLTPGYVCLGNCTTTVVDRKRERANTTGGFILLSGGLLTTIGWTMHIPGRHLRRAVQYYNRSLRQRISWHIQPHLDDAGGGLGLVARF